MSELVGRGFFVAVEPRGFDYTLHLQTNITKGLMFFSKRNLTLSLQ
jgi:hypothetical protein